MKKCLANIKSILMDIEKSNLFGLDKYWLILVKIGQYLLNIG